jgi:hypothetical protein
LQQLVPVPLNPYPAIHRVVPGVVIGVLVLISITGVTDVTGVASEISAMSFLGRLKLEFTTKLEVALNSGSLGPAIGANDIDG